MAQIAKRRVVINRGRKPKIRNRRMTPKQVKYFGTPAQKAALKRHRSRAAQHKVNRTKNTARKAYRSATRPAHRPRKNPGDILSLVLNPGQKKGKSSMAAPQKKRRSSGQRKRRPRSKANYHRPKHHSYAHSRHNPGRPYRRRRPKSNPRRRRHNPSRGGTGSLTQNAMFVLGGFAGYFGSKLLTQAVMGASNTGVVGYFGNAIATAGLALAAYMFKFKKTAAAIVAGGAIQIVARIVTDKTPFGQFTSALGVGDYQMQAFVTPQRLVDPLNSAEIEIPGGWAPRVVASAAPPAGHAGYSGNAPGGGLYSPRGIYS